MTPTHAIIVMVWESGKGKNKGKSEQVANEQREWTLRWRRSAMGKTRICMICPFCSVHVVAYVWSLCGGGKRCSCGAMFNGYGSARKSVKLMEKQRIEDEARSVAVVAALAGAK